MKTMATQNYASVFSGKVDERFSRESQAAMALNNDYKFTGVKTVNLYTVPTVGSRTEAWLLDHGVILHTVGEERTLTGENSY